MIIVKQKTVLLVILNFNGWRDTVKCLQSLKKSTYKDYQIYLIDNGSHDGSVRELTKIKDRKVIFDKQPVNTGFAGGVNIGIQYAIDNNYKYVVLLNNDIVVEPKWLENLVGAAEREKTSAVASLMMDIKGEKIIETGDIYSTWGVPMLRDEGKKREEASPSGLIFGGTGGSILYQTDLFRDIGQIAA